MKLEILLGIALVVVIYDTYHKHYYSKMVLQLYKGFQQYYKPVGVVLGLFFLYLYLKQHPDKSPNFLYYANHMVKAMPLDRSMYTMSPILDMTRGQGESVMETMNRTTEPVPKYPLGVKPTKRSVSETKKKFVASQQNWKCQDCQQQLNAWYEVDHKIRLEYGGSNGVENLVALCRECHGKKTAMENM